jgi:hypothetical protein
MAFGGGKRILQIILRAEFIVLLISLLARSTAAQTVGEYNSMSPSKQDAIVSGMINELVRNSLAPGRAQASGDATKMTRQLVNLTRALFSSEPGPLRPTKDADGYATLIFPVGFKAIRNEAKKGPNSMELKDVFQAYIATYFGKYCDLQIGSRSDAEQQVYFQTAYRREYDTALRGFKNEWTEYEHSHAEYERHYAEFKKHMQQWDDAIAQAEQDLNNHVSLDSYERASDSEKSRLIDQALAAAVAGTEQALRRPTFNDGRQKTTDRIDRDQDRAAKVDALARNLTVEQWKDLVTMIDEYARQQPETALDAVITGYFLRTVGTVSR